MIPDRGTRRSSPFSCQQNNLSLSLRFGLVECCTCGAIDSIVSCPLFSALRSVVRTLVTEVKQPSTPLSRSASRRDLAHDGYFRSADRGTIFLDEVGELPLTLQAKLLRVLEDKKVCPVGGTRAIPVDAWLLAATNRDLLESVSQGRFRADLYARLAQVILQLPPLRERREDILLLLVHLLELPTARLTVALAEALLLHPFPFNVRELIQLAAQLRLAVRGGTELDLPMVEERLAANAHVITRSAVRVPAKSPSANSEDDVAQSGEHQAAARLPIPSREELVRLLQEHKGHISRVAQAVGRSRRQVDRWLELHGLLRKDFLD